MGNGIIQADYEALGAIAGRFGQQQELVIALEEKVRCAVEALQSGGWIGAAADAFYAEMQGVLFPATQRLHAALGEAQSSTNQMCTVIRQAEEEAAEPFRGAHTPGGVGLTTPGQGEPAGGAAGAQGPARPLRTRTPVLRVPPREYALMSLAAYEEGGALPAELAGRGWRVLMAHDGSDGYHGVAYINEGQGQVVFAHRGTNPDTSIIDDLDDDLQLAMGQAPGQFNTSRAFVANVNRALAASGRGVLPVIHTGHSLGAVLADLNAGHDRARAITFENPGSAEIFENMGHRPDRDDFVAYQSSPNLINQTNRPVGHAFRVNTGVERPHPLVSALSPLPSEVHYQLGSHSMDNMVQAMDAQTGFPGEYRPLP